MNKQTVFYGSDSYEEVANIINNIRVNKIMLVCGKTYQHYSFFTDFIDRLNKEIVYFSDFCPNPTYESVKKAVKIFIEEKCDLIIAVGGGSAIDVAKCVKLYSSMNTDDEYINQNIVRNDVILLAIPTTAGTGSEATEFAVIYYKNEKISVEHKSALPQYVILDGRFLYSLSLYQRQSTLMDALSHSIEGYWSVNSDEISKKLAKQAIRNIMDNMSGYICNDLLSNQQMLIAANLAGQTINITKTTAAHAMSYKLTGIYGISHGHAVSLCLPYVFEHIYNNMDRCTDIRGKDYLYKILNEIATCMKCSNIQDSIELIKKLVEQFGFDKIDIHGKTDLKLLVKSVNKDRLSNNPVLMEQDEIERIYTKILKK